MAHELERPGRAEGAAPPPERAEGDPLSDLLLELASAPARDPRAIGAGISAGQRVGRFELLREVGRGGFGVVFEARDTELGRRVAFKAMRPSRAHASVLEQPLREEAEAAARLNHPNVVTLHDHGIHEGTPYLILELLHGETLQQQLRRGPLAAVEAIRVARDVARGLAHAHAHGVLHRDLKPGNVFLTEDGGVKLLDFGLARLLDRASLAGGTPAYMAPEQLRGERGDARADVFGAAVVLFQSLTGRLPFPVVGGRSSVLDPGPPPALDIADPPPELAALVASALSKDPGDRPQSAAALLAALDEVDRAYAGRAAASARAARRRRLRRVAAAAGAAALVAASVAAVMAAEARASAERWLKATRIASAAEGASDPLAAALLMAELGDDPPPRAVEIAQRVLAEPIPVAVLDHPRGGYGFAVSADGGRVAVGAPEGGLALWNADGTGDVRLLADGGKRTNVLAFTLDGGRIVTAAHDGDVRVWTIADGTARRFPAGESPLVALGIAPDGRSAAAGALDGRAWLLDLDGGRPPRPILHDGAVLALAHSPDGARLATASADGYVRVVDARTGDVAVTVPLAGGAIFALAWAPGGQLLAAASEDGVVRVLAPDGSVRRVLGAPGTPLTAVDWSPDGRRLATGGHDGIARVHALDAPAPEVRLRGHRGMIFRARFSPDGSRVLTVASDATARIWSADGESPPVVLRGHAAFDGLFAPDGGRVFTRGKDAVRLWRTEDPRERGVLRGHEGLVDTVEWTRDGTRVVTAGHDGTARIYSVRGGTQGLVLRDPGRVLHSADLDPDEEVLLTASEDGTARLWDAADGTLLRELRGHEASVLSAAYSPDGALVATASLDATVRVWPAREEGPSRTLGRHESVITSVAWAPDGRSVVTASQLDATVRIWPVAGGEPRVVRVLGGVFRASVTPDGTRLLVAEENGPLHVYRFDSLEELPPIAALPEGLVAATVSPDGAYLALTSSDGTVRLYPSSGDGEPLFLRGHLSSVGHAAFSPDGAELATASSDGTVRLWTVSWARLLAHLRASTTACLPALHRVQVLGEDPDDAERAVAECHRRHGRVRAPGAPGAPGSPAARAGAPSGRTAG
jgi:WD40 repeat protein